MDLDNNYDIDAKHNEESNHQNNSCDINSQLKNELNSEFWSSMSEVMNALHNKEE